MQKTGVLLHVYHLDSEKWERLVWGDPSKDKLGVGTKLFELFATEPAEQEIATIMYSGPSGKDGFAEGEYTRQFLRENVGHLEEFPRFRKLFAGLSRAQRAVFDQRIQAMETGPRIKNTLEEVRNAAAHFQSWGANRVVHIAAASHAPRCIQLQAVVREFGLIPSEQQWFTVVSDFSFAGRSAGDTAIVEPPHRADDPLLGFEPTLASLIKRYFTLSAAQKKDFILSTKQKLERIAASTAAAPGKDIADSTLKIV